MDGLDECKSEDLFDAENEDCGRRPRHDDHSDAVFGSRNNLSHEIKQEIQQKPSSTESEHNEEFIPSSSQQNNDVVDARDNKNKIMRRATRWRIVKALSLPVISLFIYFWDIVSDLRLAVSYSENGDIDLFWITMSCILIPHILMAVVDVSWVWLDSKRDQSSNCCRILLGCLTLGRIVRALTYMRHVYKAKLQPKTRDFHKDRALDEKRDCYMLDFINAFLESAPQLFVQLYLYYAFDLELTLLRVLNLLSSWFSIAWTYSAYYRCNREALARKQDVDIVGFVFFFGSVLAALAARLICMSLFLVRYYYWIGVICIVIHLILVYLWILCKDKPDFPGSATSPFGRNLYMLFFAYAGILCFMNLNNTRARCRMTVFYALIYIENIAMAALVVWKYLTKDSGSDKSIHLIVLPVGFVVHVALQASYYHFFHPKTRRCYNARIV